MKRYKVYLKKTQYDIGVKKGVFSLTNKLQNIVAK